MFSRTSRSLALTLIVVASLLMTVPGASAQAAPLNLAPTADPWDPATSNSSATPEENTAFQMTDGGTPATGLSFGCENIPPGGGTRVTPVRYWVNPVPVSEFPTTPNGTSTIPLTLNAMSPRTAPQTLGTFSVDVTWGWIEPGANFHPHDGWFATFSQTFDPTSPTSANLPTSIPLTIDFNATQGLIPAEALVFMTFELVCEGGPSYFTLDMGTFEYAYSIGAPGDADTDGDGIPDPYDDDDDGDGFTDAEEQNAGASATDATITPQSDSTACPGFTFAEVVEETGDPNQCPDDGGFPWVLVFLILVGILVLGAAGYAGMMLVNRGLRLTISHDGFQSIEKGETARYDLTVQSTAKKDIETPVILELKGVPEDWSATLAPDRLRLAGGEGAAPATVILTVIPPPGSEYEDEAQITVTATPTDEDGKTSALKPGASVKSKTIVNIGITPPEGEGKKKRTKQPKGEAAAATADEGTEPKKKRFGRKDKTEGDAAPEDGEKKSKLGGLLKRKKGEDTAEDPTVPAPETAPAAGAAAAAASGTAAAAAGSSAGKPQLSMGKMVHDPESFSAGEEVKTTVPVSNKGDAPVENLRLSLFVNDERVAHENLDLSPGEKKEVLFKWTARPDENRVRVKGDIIKK